MDGVGRVAAEQLRALLEEQAALSSALASSVEGAARRSGSTSPPAGWSGPAQRAYAAIGRRLERELALACSELAEAARESRRAATTLQAHG